MLLGGLVWLGLKLLRVTQATLSFVPPAVIADHGSSWGTKPDGGWRESKLSRFQPNFLGALDHNVVAWFQGTWILVDLCWCASLEVTMYARDGMRDIFSRILSKPMEVLSISHFKLSSSFSLSWSMYMVTFSGNTQHPNEIDHVICLLLFMNLLEKHPMNKHVTSGTNAFPWSASNLMF